MAEDGKVFFAQQMVSGVRAVLTPSNGYFHLLPRLIAWAASPLPVFWQPLFYQVAGVLIAAFCAAFFVLPECRFILASDDLRMAVSALALIDCHGEDLFANVAALQVFLFPVGLILLLSDRVGPFRAVSVAIIALTAPALILFLPLAAWKYVRHRSLIATVYLVCAAVQVGVILTHSQQASNRGYPLWLPFAAVLESWVYRVLATTVIGFDWAMFAGAKGGLTLAAVMAGISLAQLFWVRHIFRLKQESSRVFWVSMAIGPALIFEACLTRGELLDFFHNPAHFVLGGGARYFFMPACVLFLATALLIEQLCRRWAHPLRPLALTALFVVGIHANYRIGKYEDLEWGKKAAVIEAWEHSRNIPIQVQIPPSKNAQWLIELP